jgi:MFS family permease
MFAGFCMVTLVSYTFFVWTPAVFQRSYGWNAGEIGLAFGLIVLTFGTAGAFFGGWMTDQLARRGHLDAPLKVAAFGFVGCGVFGGLAPLMPSAGAALALLGPAIFLSNTPYACAGTSIQLIVPNRARAQITALYITLITLVGLGVGPTVVGLMTDYVFQNPASPLLSGHRGGLAGADHVHAVGAGLAPLPRVARRGVGAGPVDQKRSVIGVFTNPSG